MKSADKERARFRWRWMLLAGVAFVLPVAPSAGAASPTGLNSGSTTVISQPVDGTTLVCVGQLTQEFRIDWGERRNVEFTFSFKEGESVSLLEGDIAQLNVLMRITASDAYLVGVEAGPPRVDSGGHTWRVGDFKVSRQTGRFQISWSLLGTDDKPLAYSAWQGTCQVSTLRNRKF